MGEVDFSFKASVPVFDANIAMGRRHDRRVTVDNAEDTLKAMRRAGVDRAVAYAPHAVGYDPQDGNGLLMELIEGHEGFFPQFVCNPTWDDLDAFAGQVKELGVRSIRMVPALHNYPFRDWLVKPWLDWAARERVPIWMPVVYDFIGTDYTVDPEALHDTLADHPDVNVVLSEVYYFEQAWAVPLLRSLPNLHIEISRTINTDDVSRLVNIIGDKRVLFGSRFPDAAILPQLYWVERCGFSQDTLKAICAGNLERLLGLE